MEICIFQRYPHISNIKRKLNKMLEEAVEMVTDKQSYRMMDVSDNLQRTCYMKIYI
uniref:Uncharacterized protein n=1 Tax=Arion vulgaris TaxID=1028688 RepID=A0A0B7AU96_9EUPU